MKADAEQLDPKAAANQLTFPDDFKKDPAGRVTLREFLRVRFHDYDVADKNHDGVLSLDEVVAAYDSKKASR